MTAITVSNLGKAYKQYPTRWARLIEWLDPRGKPRHRLHWVLQDINFTVQPGEAVGIVGINGAGKSTLLKMITGTTQPTTGSVQINGRVAALLELGMGFHPDFTGRQNAVMAGQLLGYSIEEIAALMPEIEAFAEIGDYIDQPVRVYSSGMQMRLAFSVATARRPDVLIVDEALSVGDAYFQHKSFDRIREFRQQGTTLLIVSHDKQAILSICDRAILLDGGRLAMQGEPEAVLDYYNARLADSQGGHAVIVTDSKEYVGTESGSFDAVITKVTINDSLGNPIKLVKVGQLIQIHVKVFVVKNLPSLTLGCGIKNRYGQLVFGTNTYNTGQVVEKCTAGDTYTYIFSCDANLGVGSYSVIVGVHSDASHLFGNYHWLDRAIVFDVINDKYCNFSGIAWSNMRFSIMTGRAFPEELNVLARDDVVIAKAKYGKMCVYAKDSVIGFSLLKQGGFQEEKIREVVQYLSNVHSFVPSLFIDIGANIGTHTVYSIKTGLFRNAIAIEPDQANYRLLRSNITINDIEDRVVTYNMAVSSCIGELEMELSGYNFGDHRIRASENTEVSFGEERERLVRKVQSNKIDNIILGKGYDFSGALAWIDTQGHEGHIFNGGSRFFSPNSGIRFVVTEFWPYGLERANGKSMYFEFIEKCSEIYDLNVVGWQKGGSISVERLNDLYKDMLSRTEKEVHPHTDLLLVLR